MRTTMSENANTSMENITSLLATLPPDLKAAAETTYSTEMEGFVKGALAALACAQNRSA